MASVLFSYVLFFHHEPTSVCACFVYFVVDLWSSAVQIKGNFVWAFKLPKRGPMRMGDILIDCCLEFVFGVCFILMVWLGFCCRYRFVLVGDFDFIPMCVCVSVSLKFVVLIRLLLYHLTMYIILCLLLCWDVLSLRVWHVWTCLFEKRRIFVW